MIKKEKKQIELDASDKRTNIDDIHKKIDNMPDGFIPQEDANFFKFENIGDNVLGKLTGVDKSTRYGFNIYNILNKATNEIIRCHGSKDLDTKMSRIELGDTVYIEFVDTVAVPNGEMKIFSVGVAPKN